MAVELGAVVIACDTKGCHARFIHLPDAHTDWSPEARLRGGWSWVEQPGAPGHEAECPACRRGSGPVLPEYCVYCLGMVRFDGIRHDVCQSCGARQPDLTSD